MQFLKNRVWLIVAAYYGILLVLITLVSPHILLYPAQYRISESCCIVKGVATTGPSVRVIEGSEFLSDAVPVPHPEDLNTGAIELTGRSIFQHILEYPDYYYCNWLIFGRVTRTTERYKECGDGTIPVFEVEKRYPMIRLYDLVRTGIILGLKFPLGLILSLIVLIWPVFMLLIAVICKRRRNQ